MKKFQLKKDNQIFSRFEFKYSINKNLSKVIQQEVKNFTTNDDIGMINGKWETMIPTMMRVSWREYITDNNMYYRGRAICYQRT